MNNSNLNSNVNSESSEMQQIRKSNSTDEMNKDFELGHIIGLNTSVKSPVQCVPAMNEAIVYCVGGIVISEDLTEKNNQVFFRHGRNQISCFKLSNSGRFLAVGFTSGDQNLDKKLPVSIILWDFVTKELIYELTGISKAVTLIEFSQDDRFISATGLDNYLYIWEVETGYKCFSRVYEFPTTLIHWTTISPMQKNTSNPKPDYTITIGNINGLSYIQFYFELRSMQYNTRVSKFSLPSSGFIRNFTCGVYDQQIKGVYFGTAGGELALFSIDNLLYKSSFNVINNGVADFLMFVEEENGVCFIIGGGDGKVKKMIREGNNISNVKHILVNEIQLNGKVTSLSLLPDGKEVICSTSLGYIYRILVCDLTYSLHSISHNSSVNDISYNTYGRINDKFFTVDDNGNTCLWDLNDFALLSSLSEDSPAKSLTIGDDGKFIYKLNKYTLLILETAFIGFADGFLKNYTISFTPNFSFNKIWEVPAHRGNVNTIYVDGNYILTGGEDGIVRVWTRKTHELIIQFSGHHKDVYNVFPDLNKPNLIYSCGGDRSLNTFDIKLQKRVNIHNIKNGFICGIAQKLDADYEISKINKY